MQNEKDEINVYWSPVPPESNRKWEYPIHTYLDPSLSYSNLAKIKGGGVTDFKKCPAYIDVLKNMYNLHFAFDYDLHINWDNETTHTTHLDQEAFEDHVWARSYEKRMITFIHSYIFFTDADSLILELTPAYLSDNNFVKSTTIIPGSYDIGKWCRPVDCSFVVHDNINYIHWKREDQYCHVKFKTDKKIKLNKFSYTKKLDSIVETLIKSREDKEKWDGKWEYYYSQLENSNIKNQILTEMRNNLL